MRPSDPYNANVRRRFADPRYAGDLPREYPTACFADVRDAASESRLQLGIGVESGTIVAMRFRAWGCPHFIAAAESLCAAFENQPVDQLAAFNKNEMMAELSVPEEKTGRILLLEDALAVLLQQASPG